MASQTPVYQPRMRVRQAAAGCNRILATGRRFAASAPAAGQAPTRTAGPFQAGAPWGVFGRLFLPETSTRPARPRTGRIWHTGCKSGVQLNPWDTSDDVLQAQRPRRACFRGHRSGRGCRDCRQPHRAPRPSLFRTDVWRSGPPGRVRTGQRPSPHRARRDRGAGVRHRQAGHHQPDTREQVTARGREGIPNTGIPGSTILRSPWPAL